MNTMDQSNMRPVEMSLTGLVEILWRHRILFVICLALSTALAVVYLRVVTPRYTVILQLAPISTSPVPSGALGMLGALTGANIDLGGGTQPFQIFQAGLQSRVAADALAADQELMKGIFLREWSEAEGRWREPPPGMVRTVINTIKSTLGLRILPWEPPGGARLAEFLKDRVRVTQSRTSPLATVELQMPDPRLAADLLLQLHATVDRIMRERALNRAEGYINSITAQLQRVTVSDYRQALVENLAEQEKIRMMASANVAFSSEIFSGPAISPWPTSPSAMRALAVAILGGSGMAVGLALLLEHRRSRRRVTKIGREILSEGDLTPPFEPQMVRSK
jgi:hypothetical protein